MGHSKEMNEQVYQAPQALMEITRLGRKLQNIDEGKKFLPFHFSILHSNIMSFLVIDS